MHGEGWSKSGFCPTLERKRLENIHILPDFHLYWCGEVFFEICEDFLLFICVRRTVSCPLLQVYDCEIDSERCKRVCIWLNLATQVTQVREGVRKGAAPEECASASEDIHHAQDTLIPQTYIHTSSILTFSSVYITFTTCTWGHTYHIAKKHYLYHKYGLCKFLSYPLNTLTLSHLQFSCRNCSLSVFQFYLTVIGVICFQQSRKQVGGKY